MSESGCKGRLCCSEFEMIVTSFKSKSAEIKRDLGEPDNSKSNTHPNDVINNNNM